MSAIPHAAAARTTHPLVAGRHVPGALLVAFTLAVLFSTALTNLLAAVISVFAAVLWIRSGTWRLLTHPLLATCLAFLAWVVLRDLAAGASMTQMLQSFSSVRTLAFVVLWAPLFLVPSAGPAVIRWGMLGLVVYALAALGFMAWQGEPLYPWVGSNFNLDMPLVLNEIALTLYKRSPNISGPILLLAIFGSLQWALDHPARRAWLLAFAALGTAALFLATLRRSSYLGFVLCLLTFVVLNWPRISARIKVLAIGATALVAVIVAVGPAGEGIQRAARDAAQFLGAPAHERGKQGTSEAERLHFWTVAQGVIHQAPLVGTSVSNYREHYLELDAAIPNSAPKHANPHNEYLYVWGALGLVGLALYLATFYAGWRTTAVHPDHRKLYAYFMTAVLSNMAVNSYIVDMLPGHAHVLVLLTLAAPGLQAFARFR